MTDWTPSLRQALAGEGRAVLVTIAATRGSAPRESGASMIVTAGDAQGTIGGGHLEFEAMRIAREALRTGEGGSWLVRFPLAARLGQCCGGVATILFRCIDAAAEEWLVPLAARVAGGETLALATVVTREPTPPTLVALDEDAVRRPPAEVFAAAQCLLANPDAAPMVIEAGDTWFVERVAAQDFRVVVFGNGHVGRALVQILGALPCRVIWVDERETDFPAAVPPNVTVVATDAPEAEVREAMPGSMFLVMTHSHALDFDLVAAILARDDFAYAGMIGSKAKRAQLERRLAARGFAEKAIARVTCPIGSAGPRGREPGVIALAVAAEIVQAREQRGARADRRVSA
jgi:xanthine dehydrogenase accessory factor